MFWNENTGKFLTNLATAFHINKIEAVVKIIVDKNTSKHLVMIH